MRPSRQSNRWRWAPWRNSSTSCGVLEAPGPKTFRPSSSCSKNPPLDTTPMIDCRIDGHVALITLNNPAANTFTAEGLRELKDLIRDLNGNLEVYAAVVTGHGDKFFSAGADLKTFADGDKVKARLMAQLFGAAFEALQ